MHFPQRLTDGYRTFRQSRLPHEQTRYKELSDQGQSPETMIIGCCDSRVSPEVIFDARPGELFVVRNVANLVPPYEPDGTYHGVSAALEFAVQGLRVKHIVVLGHAQCGGVRAYAEHTAPLSPGDFIGKWMELLGPAARSVDRDDPDFLTRLEQASVVRATENLMTFPYVRAAVERGDLALHAAYFGVATGTLFVRDPATGHFAAVR